MNIGDLLGGGFRVLARRPKELIIWSVIQLIVIGGLFAVMMPALSSMLAFQQAAAAGGPPALPPGFGMFFLIEFAVLIWFLIMFAAVVRMTASDGNDRWAWLRFGMDEIRLIGLGILFMIALIVIEIVVVLLGVLLVGAVTAASTVAGIILAIILIIAGICAAIWASVRISLIAPIMVLDHSFAIRKGWRATKGHFWTLFGTYLVMMVGYFVLESIILAIMSPILLSGLIGARDPQQIIEAQQQMIASMTTPSVGLIIFWIFGSVIGTALLVYYNSVLATAAIAATDHSGASLAELETAFE